MNPTFLLGLDGATFALLDPLMAAGHMPFLQRFLADSVRANLRSTPHPLTPPAWTTLITGRTPGHHGIFDFLKADLRDNRPFFTLNNFRDIQCETLWTLVSRWGGRVLSVNYPLLAPPPAVNGAIVPGLLNWRHLRRNVYPPGLYDQLKALPGFDPKEISCDFEEVGAALQMSDQELVPWIRAHIIISDRHWFRVLSHLMKTEPADLTVVVFDGVDKIQHGCWRFLDAAHLPARLNPVEQVLRDLSLEYFRQLDGFLEELVRLAGPTANVFIASDHGFGPSERSFRVNKWLEQQGYLHWPAAGGMDAGRKNTHFINLDWGRTTAYAQTSATNGIHVRVRAQPGDPGLAPEEYPAFRARLVEQLRAVRDPVTGGPFFKDVLLREEAFPGPHGHRAPDLTLVPFDHGFVTVLNVEPVIATRPYVMGMHHPLGILIGCGPALAKPRTLDDQSIVDVAPTLLHSLGLPVPEDFEGQVMTDVFDAAWLAAHPVRRGPATEPPRHGPAPKADPAQDAAEEAGVMERLRALGYVE